MVIQRLVYEFDLANWLAQIGECLRFSEPIHIWIGFSFLVKDETNTLEYIYAIRQLSSYNFKITSKDQFTYFINDWFKSMSISELLDKTFISTKEDNPFYKSGFRPYKLICSYIWIRK